MLKKLGIYLLEINKEKLSFLKNIFDNFHHLSCDCFSTPEAFLKSFLDKRPDVIFINPFFKSAKIDGFSLLVKLKKFNSISEKKVDIVIVGEIEKNYLKVIQKFSGYYCKYNDVARIEDFLKIFLEKKKLVLKRKTDLDNFEVQLPEISLDYLVNSCEFENSDKIIENLKKFIAINDETDKEEVKQLKSFTSENIWSFYVNIAIEYVTNNEIKFPMIFRAFLRLRAILDEEWLNSDTIKSICKHIYESDSDISEDFSIFYSDEWVKAVFEEKVSFTYDDLLINEFRRLKNYFIQLKFLKTNSEKDYNNSISIFLGLRYFENYQKELRKQGKFFKPTENQIKEKGKQLFFEFEIMEMLKPITNTCVGKQGIKNPFFMSESEDIRKRITTKKSVEKYLKKVESIDPKIFCRVRLNEKKHFQEYRIPPYVILTPCIGKFGVCWDSWHDTNKRKGPGRIGIPVISEGSLYNAVLYSLGSLRWRTAKSVADIYWMEEGITGQYYQYWEQNRKRKYEDSGENYVASRESVEESFILDYIIWIKSESIGRLKLRKEVREIFWFNIPFSETIKKVLNERGQIYEELNIRDQRRKLSGVKK